MAVHVIDEANRCKSIFIGTGVWRSMTLGVKGESLGHVHFAIDYLANQNAYNLGNRLARKSMTTTRRLKL